MKNPFKLVILILFMQKKGELSNLTVAILISVLIIALCVVIFFIVRNINNVEKGTVLVKDLDLKISQVKTVDDRNMEITVKRNEGEGDFSSLSFVVDDGSNIEIIKKETFIEQGGSEIISLKFILVNASRIKRISITPLFTKGNGEEIVGEIEDEYVTPNTCSNFCPVGAQCGFNDCGMQCGSGCASGYLCLNYKCIKQKTSSGGGGGGSSSGSSSDNTDETCTDTCASLVKQCGTHSICGVNINCGNCSSGYVCSSGLCVLEETCTDTCNSLNYNCGTHSICGVNVTCGTCSTEYSCQVSNGTCMKDCTPTTCVALSRTCGTVSNGCGGTLNCGTCSTGYSCAVNGTCIKEVVIDCGTVSCKSGEYCSHGVCLLNVSGETYFVATNGNDNNPGTFSQPFYSWQKGVQVARPGDIVYIREGIWTPTNHILASGGYDTGAIAMTIDPTAQNFGVSGTATAPIRYYNYPGETPIMDGKLLAPNSDRWQSGISISNSQHIYFKGLTIRNVFQSPPDLTHPKPYSEVFGVGSFESANLKFENIVVYNINGRGFQHWGGAWDESDGPGSLFDSDNTSWINCDAYNLFDRYALSPGNAADGWKVVGYASNYYSWEGCRAWNYSDDGFDPNGAHRFFKNCWAMSTNYYQNLFDGGSSGSWDPEGNGFKISGINPNYPGYSEGGEVFVRMENSIAAYCVGSGVANDIEVNYEDQWPNNGVFYNNIAYRTNGGFFDLGSNRGATSRPTEYRNNIAFGSTYDGQGMSPLYEVGIYNPNVYPHSHNTWRATLSEPWPGWEYNPDYSVTDGDFVSVDATQLTLPRKADGSLPDITFLYLKQGSDLIDGGVVIPGYHCATSGSHPGQNCREWYGAAPDLGPFESNY